MTGGGLSRSLSDLSRERGGGAGLDPRMESGNVPPAPRPREDAGGRTPRAGVGETSVACCVGGSPNAPGGTVADNAGDDDAEVGVPRDGVEGRLGIDADVDVDGEEEDGGGNGDRVRRT